MRLDITMSWHIKTGPGLTDFSAVEEGVRKAKVTQRLSRHHLAAILSIIGGVLLVIGIGPVITGTVTGAILGSPFTWFGILAIFSSVVVKDWDSRIFLQIVSSVLAWVFTIVLFVMAYNGFVKHDNLHMLPELYASTVILSLGGTLVFAGGILDWTGQRRQTDGSRPS